MHENINTPRQYKEAIEDSAVQTVGALNEIMAKCSTSLLKDIRETLKRAQLYISLTMRDEFILAVIDTELSKRNQYE